MKNTHSLGRRGFGAVQIVALLLLAIATLVFVIFMILPETSPVSKVHTNDVHQVYPRVVLDNLLVMPVTNPSSELLKEAKHPTIADLLLFNASAVPGQVVDTLEALDSFGGEIYYYFKAGNEEVSSHPTKENMYHECGLNFRQAQALEAKKTIAGVGVVELVLCEVNS